ncbi:ABC transporter substrate-binding protein [Paracandidimonas soli]|uniref:Amino acid/amide ABC transporter substrate-binding protein (HAAT family) n=1 Tax=Paracandidimonas soli TaxID=1917182 RepID=A0A4R3VDE0_9BURK|nr:ABC transporter substrate-binding protein [Paracandidimonas soli]TCV01903.1 amino acid/amide ABC transporter substrate-binding protein (HAAT family) [Paracandidimonas soli]
MKLKTLTAALLCATSALPLALQAQETGDLKIGALVTLSGAGAAWGQGMKNAAELAALQVNKDGGLEVGGKRYKVSVVAYDDKYQANEAVTVANRLVFEDKVKYIIGPVGSAPVLAIQPITEKNKVIVITLGFTAKALQADKPFTFRPNVTTAEVSQPQIDWLVKTQGVKKVGALFPNDETGQQIAEDLKAAYGKAGAELAATEFFERDRVDFVPLLTRMSARGIDTIELDGNSPTTAGLIVKQAREIGFTGKIVRTGGPATQEIVNVAGQESAEGMFVHTPINPELPSTKAYSDLYAANYKHAMNGFSPAFYDGTNMLFEAMRRAGSVTDTEAIAKEMAALKDFKGALGTLNWTGQESYGINHQLNAPFYVAEVKDGKEVIRASCDVERCE